MVFFSLVNKIIINVALLSLGRTTEKVTSEFSRNLRNELVIAEELIKFGSGPEHSR